jgi:hypothetical protein
MLISYPESNLLASPAMKTHSPPLRRAGFALGIASILAGTLPASAAPGSLESANVTKIINDVRVYDPAGSARKAALGELIKGRSSLHTGRRSRSELLFQDQTLTRIGANSIFSFEPGTRDVHLQQGTLLLQVPKNAGGARINTATVTASVTGTTIMMEYFVNRWTKVIVLEGSLELWSNGKQRRKVTIKEGEMAVFRANDAFVPKPVKVDLRRLLKTSALASPEVFGELPAEANAKINRAIKEQEDLIREGALAPQPEQRNDPAAAANEDPPGLSEVAGDRADPPGSDGPRIITDLPRFE